MTIMKKVVNNGKKIVFQKFKTDLCKHVPGFIQFHFNYIRSDHNSHLNTSNYKSHFGLY